MRRGREPGVLYAEVPLYEVGKPGLSQMGAGRPGAGTRAAGSSCAALKSVSGSLTVHAPSLPETCFLIQDCWATLTNALVSGLSGRPGQGGRGGGGSRGKKPGDLGLILAPMRRFRATAADPRPHHTAGPGSEGMRLCPWHGYSYRRLHGLHAPAGVGAAGPPAAGGVRDGRPHL